MLNYVISCVLLVKLQTLQNCTSACLSFLDIHIIIFVDYVPLYSEFFALTCIDTFGLFEYHA